VRSILDGHVILTRELGARGHYPAIDVLKSASRVMTAVADAGHLEAARRLRELLAAYEKNRDLILIGAYQRGSDPLVDRAIDQIGDLEGFLRQGLHEKPGFEETLDQLRQLVERDG
jgi:flagellar biosynthesis/type III secretory pathway ATPase